MERAIEIFALVHLIPMGISHIVKREVWAEFFIVLAKKGRSGVFLHGFLSLWFGSVIAGFYRVWSDTGLALTAFGWLLVLKAVHCFLFPDAALRSCPGALLFQEQVPFPTGPDFRLVSQLQSNPHLIEPLPVA